MTVIKQHNPAIDIWETVLVGAKGDKGDKGDPGDITAEDLPYVNVKDYGAVGDGVADDAAAVQAAVDSLGGQRGVVEFPRGTYRFATGLDPKRAILSGQGKPPNTGGGGTTLKFDGTAGIKSTLEDNTSWSARYLTIRGAGVRVTNGQVLVDFSGQNGPSLTHVRIRETHYGLRLGRGATVECNYGVFHHVDFFECTRGLDAGNGTIGANSHTFVGGRVWGCGAEGWYLETAVNNITAIGVAFEAAPATAVKSLATTATFFGCRFETTSTNLHVLAGAGRHYLFGCHHSSGFDVIDENSPTVVFGISATSTTEGQTLPAVTAGGNLVANGAFVHHAAGVPRGWSVTHSSMGTGYTFTQGTGDATVDTFGRLNNVGATNPRLYQALTVVPNVPHAVSLKARTSLTVTQAYIRLGTAVGGTDYLNKSIETATWKDYRFSFTPTTSTVNLTAYLNGAVAGTIDLADVVVTVGTQTAPGFVPRPGEDGGTIYGNVGFYGGTPVAKPTGVAVTAEAIHAALVSLGLISA